MTTQDLKDFSLCLDQLAEVFNVQLSSMKKHAYYMALQDYPLDAIQASSIQVLKEETFFPVPAILRAYAKEWLGKQRVLAQGNGGQGDMLALREELVDPEEVRRLIASVWPGEMEGEPLYEPRGNE